MPEARTTIPEVVLQGGARMAMAAHPLSEFPLRGPHRYAFYALGWLSGGAAAFVGDFLRHEVPAGSLVFIPPGQVHGWEPGEAGAHLSLLGFVPEVFTGRLLDIRLITELPFFQADGHPVRTVPGELRGALEGLFAQAARRYAQVAKPEADKPFLTLPRGGEGLLLAYLHVILAEAATLGPEVGAAPLTLGGTADVRLARLFRLHAESEITRRRPVAHYAGLLNVTPDHLTRVVRRVTGQPPSVWLQERLLLEARRLLTFTDQPTSQIAEALSFPTPTQFSQWFRKLSGQTPREVRRARRGSPDFQQF